MSLARFHTAQDTADNGIALALQELRTGRKQSHWIWYVFPQLAELGRSSTARFYGLQNLEEARAYLRDATLRARLEAATDAVAQQLSTGTQLVDLMGGTTDALKLVSSLTLFEQAARDEGRHAFVQTCEKVLHAAEQQGFPRCAYTLNEIAQEKS